MKCYEERSFLDVEFKNENGTFKDTVVIIYPPNYVENRKSDNCSGYCFLQEELFNFWKSQTVMHIWGEVEKRVFRIPSLEIWITEKSAVQILCLMHTKSFIAQRVKRKPIGTLGTMYQASTIHGQEYDIYRLIPVKNFILECDEPELLENTEIRPECEEKFFSEMQEDTDIQGKGLYRYDMENFIRSNDLQKLVDLLRYLDNEENYKIAFKEAVILGNKEAMDRILSEHKISPEDLDYTDEIVILVGNNSLQELVRIIRQNLNDTDMLVWIVKEAAKYEGTRDEIIKMVLTVVHYENMAEFCKIPEIFENLMFSWCYERLLVNFCEKADSAGVSLLLRCNPPTHCINMGVSSIIKNIKVPIESYIESLEIIRNYLAENLIPEELQNIYSDIILAACRWTEFNLNEVFIVRHIISHGGNGTSEALIYAINSGTTDVVSTLLMSRTPIPDISLEPIIRKGQDGMIALLIFYGAKVTESDIQLARESYFRERTVQIMQDAYNRQNPL